MVITVGTQATEFLFRFIYFRERESAANSLRNTLALSPGFQLRGALACLREPSSPGWDPLELFSSHIPGPAPLLILKCLYFLLSFSCPLVSEQVASDGYSNKPY